MFAEIIDEEIKLALLQPSFAPLYAKLAADNREYLSRWLGWTATCYDEQDFLSFIQRSLHQYASIRDLLSLSSG